MHYSIVGHIIVVVLAALLYHQDMLYHAMSYHQQMQHATIDVLFGSLLRPRVTVSAHLEDNQTTCYGMVANYIV